MDRLKVRDSNSFSIGEVVYYVKPSTYTIRRSRVADIQMRRLHGLPLIEICDKYVMDNGDINELERLLKVLQNCNNLFVLHKKV